VRSWFILLYSVSLFSQGNYYHSVNGEKVTRLRYVLSYVEAHEQAEWVYYKLNSKLVRGNIKRSNNFREDYSISTGSAKLSDYKFSGYDRGHLAPAGDMKSSYAAMSESFLMSNISPQDPSFNRGIWKKLESLVRGWAENNYLHIVTAGILKGKLKTIGSSNVSVPRYFYKIIYATNESKMIGFVIPNSKISSSLKNYVKSVDEIEKLTGIDFFYNLEDDLENKLEAESNIRDWDFSAVSTNSNSSGANAVQCKGIAKTSGNRCRNKTKNENQYCYAHQSQSIDYKIPARTDYVGKCNAKTKSGSRCKRNASSGSSYCWQHK
jgi:endonuclease G